ncbi:MAG: DUF433 domain-containing protein, partial [Candidatus Poribacteria bacterium]
MKCGNRFYSGMVVWEKAILKWYQGVPKGTLEVKSEPSGARMWIASQSLFTGCLKPNDQFQKLYEKVFESEKQHKGSEGFMKIQDGKLFFDGTNVPVRETLQLFAYGKSIDQIADTLQGKVSKEEIANALKQAIEAMEEIYSHPEPFDLDSFVEKFKKEMDELEAKIGERATRRLIARRMKKEKYTYPAEGTEFLTKHITRHPKICGGQVCFDGTRRLVAPVLKSFLTGKPIDEIVRRWEGEISRDAIVEALNLSINA